MNREAREWRSAGLRGRVEGQRGARKTAGILRALERRDPSDIFSHIKSASYSTADGSESLVFAATSPCLF